MLVFTLHHFERKVNQKTALPRKNGGFPSRQRRILQGKLLLEGFVGLDKGRLSGLLQIMNIHSEQLISLRLQWVSKASSASSIMATPTLEQ